MLSSSSMGCLALVLAAFQGHAALVDRGGGLLYDTVLDVTWLQDANYARTSGFDADGALSHAVADRWIDDLVYYDSIRDVEYADWRLPTVLVADLPFHYGWWVSGGSIDPTPTQGPHTELSFMYYVNLGLNGYHNNNGNWGSDFGVNGDSTFGGEADLGPVRNLQGGEYWLDFSMADVSRHYDTQPFTFNTDSGNHYVRSSHQLFTWAMRDGDVIAVTEPPIATLAISGLAGFIVMLLFGRNRWSTWPRGEDYQF